MLQQMPDMVNFIRQAEYQACIEGSWPIAKMERLTDLLSAKTGELTARLAFGRHAGFYSVEGELETTLSVVCQRCLQNMEYQVSRHFLLGLVKTDDDADELPEDMEPFLVTEEDQSIIDMLEDELLLSLPIAPAHDQDCSSFLLEQNQRQQEEKEASCPFAVLKGLKLD